MTGTTTSPVDGLLDRLAAAATVDVEGTTAHWRCRVLTPAEAAQLRVGLSMLQAAATPPGGDTPRDPSASDVAELVGHMQKLVCACVVGASVSGKEWAPVRLVQRMDQADRSADPPRLFVGVISPDDVGIIAHAATSAYRGARAAAAPFRGEPGHAAGP